MDRPRGAAISLGSPLVTHSQDYLYDTYMAYTMVMDAANEIPVTELRAHLADVLNEATYSGTRTFITRAGKRIAAIVPADEADLLEDAEDAYLMQLSKQARANQGDKPYKPLSEVLAEYAEEFGEELA